MCWKDRAVILVMISGSTRGKDFYPSTCPSRRTSCRLRCLNGRSTSSCWGPIHSIILLRSTRLPPFYFPQALAGLLAKPVDVLPGLEHHVDSVKALFRYPCRYSNTRYFFVSSIPHREGMGASRLFSSSTALIIMYKTQLYERKGCRGSSYLPNSATTIAFQGLNMVAQATNLGAPVTCAEDCLCRL